MITALLYMTPVKDTKNFTLDSQIGHVQYGSNTTCRESLTYLNNPGPWSLYDPLELTSCKRFVSRPLRKEDLTRMMKVIGDAQSRRKVWIGPTQNEA